MNIVHIEGDYMNTIVTSKEEILKNSRELIREKGWAAVSIRSVASACGVSVGSIYNLSLIHILFPALAAVAVHRRSKA